MGRDMGSVGETFVTDWLRQQNSIILAQNWHCPWGELDIVAQGSDLTVAFVEVKTRRHRNLDHNGLLAITPIKQKRLIQTAALFLEAHPTLQNNPCRFDVALVLYRPRVDPVPAHALQQPKISLGQPMPRNAYELELTTYLEGAFLI